MMHDMDELLDSLSARLPELEWKISNLFFVQVLPLGLFSARFGLTAKGCIEEIKADIFALSQQKSLQRASYIAQKIHQKINVLVNICQIQDKKVEEKNHFDLDKLSTRHQWIQELEKNIETLTSQQLAMEKALKQMKATNDVEGTLSIQIELGEVNKRLTLAKEKLIG